jgi:hypothetical protein
MLPLVIAVTGHRDLLDSELDGIRQQVRRLLMQLGKTYPERSLSVMSALAEGADRLVAQVALDLGVQLIVPLPMSKEQYLKDFESDESREEFESLCRRAAEMFELPVAAGCTVEEISTPGPERNRQYAQLGVFLCAHCHILLALWDGKPGSELGGTGQVVKFHHDNIMPGYTSTSVATQQMLVDDESDLVYHVVCSRDRPDGSPQDGMRPLDWSWFTKDRTIPRGREIPRQHQLIFQRSSEFSRDAVKYAKRIAAEKYPLYEKEDEGLLPPGTEDINRLFCDADWLALHYQKRTLWTLRTFHVLAFLMGLMFILFSDVDRSSYYMFAFLAFFGITAAVQQLTKHRGWHRKYLDYRALAEGLRVQFYLAVAGVASDNVSKYTHDNFLQTQDPELGWIRNVMRVAGTRSNVTPNLQPAGLRFALREWIGDATGGQLGYFRKKTTELIARDRTTERFGLASLLTSVVVVLVFVFTGASLPDSWFDPLTAIMGTMLLVYGIRHGYAYAIAEKELIKQYEFMLRIFNNAHRRLENAKDPVEQRQILLALGGSALDEHAGWILLHRDRSIDESEIWRVGG